ncbi:MAG: alginate export family protein [Saprospiraceae bacterium]|uniref:Alginate export family protein n=1 Tax=Candidatus Opimibacter skivensis TaxID=2982028 RepID=A0A9D7SZR1_9BACT|nr:alginate export family protein [Candidatus Opimibacter skivensis]
MKSNLLLSFILFVSLIGNVKAQYQSSTVEDNSTEAAHSILPADGIIPYLPRDTGYFSDIHLPLKDDGSVGSMPPPDKVQFTPLVNFFFRPEGTFEYKEAGLARDTGHLNFYLRGDFGGKVSLPKNIDMVFNLQSYGVYTRSLGPLDPNLSLYEAYVDMKKLDRAGRLSLRFGRMCLGKYGTEILVGDDDFTKGRSFESVRLRYKTDRSTHDVMWVQLYQQAPDSAGIEWNHPLLVSSFNTFHFSEALNLDANLPYLITQYNSGFNTSVFMPDVRIFGQMSNIRYSAEMIYQSGTGHAIVTKEAKCTVKAYAAEVSAGYFSKDDKVSIDLTYYRASGDDKPGDKEIKSYNVLWQNEHRRFGFIDAFKGSNVQAATFHLNWKLGRLLATGVHGVYATVLESKDRSTGIATVNLNTLTTDNKTIGYGGDWYFNYYFNHYLNMQFTTSVFSPGEYFTAANGVDKTMVRMYLILALRI